jgi:hypothetical protein
MNGIRGALAVTTAERYCGMAINFLLIAVISRVLTPGGNRHLGGGNRARNPTEFGS